MRKFIDITGKRFGQYVAVTYVSNSNWNCKCDCGKEFIRSYSNITGKNCVSCGCFRKISGPEGRYWTAPGKIEMNYFNRFYRSSLKLGRDCTITPEYIWKLWIQQNGRCALSGTLLSIPNKKNYPLGTCGSLDRIDSSKGYIEGNVQWVTKDINFAKQELKQSEFIDLCRKIVDYNKEIST